MTTAVFSYSAWSLRYPELVITNPATGQPIVTEPLAVMLFAEAGIYLANDDCSLVQADPITYQPRLSILNMIVAHLAAIGPGIAGSGLVGRITDASQGSVSIKTDLGALPGSATFWAQTSYGLSAYQALAGYRTARYVPPRRGGGYGWRGLGAGYGGRAW